MYKTSEIIKLSDNIALHNALLAKNNWKVFEKQLTQIPLNFFQKTTEQHNHSTRSALKNFAFVEEVNSKSQSDTKLLLYGKSCKITQHLT